MDTVFTHLSGASTRLSLLPTHSRPASCCASSTHLCSLPPLGTELHQGAGVSFLKVEAEAVPEVSVLFDISVVPTFVFLKGEDVVDKLEGAHPSELAKKLQALLSSPSATAASAVKKSTPTSNQQGLAVNGKPDINERIRQLIHSAPVMLFMKGAPSEPRCGFSSKIIGMLKEEGIDFASFDVLSDEDIRQGIKTYSQWPTFPQLYVNGELVGGLDILTEMKQSGSLKDQLGVRDAPAVPDTSLPPPPPPQSLDDRLRALVKRAPVMLFMKGTPETPRCGFSSQLVDMLRQDGIEFETFDILTDEDVRQGLKVFSDWKTYPQLYVNGELVGGLDIVKEMRETGGPLKPQLQISTPQSLEDRLRALTSRSPVMVFMKGSPEAPKCGFSAKLYGILKDEGFNFDTFDILVDEEVRQGLKSFSNWPTYPQMYVDGELVGGLDIVNEMRTSGELQAFKR